MGVDVCTTRDHTWEGSAQSVKEQHRHWVGYGYSSLPLPLFTSKPIFFAVWLWEKLNNALNNASIKETHKDRNLDAVCFSLVPSDNLPLYNEGRVVLWHYFCLLGFCSWLSPAQSDMASFLSGKKSLDPAACVLCK